MESNKPENVFPTSPDFTVNGKVYSIRKIGIKDHAWLSDRHGGPREANAIFNKPDLKAIVEFAYHQLSQEDRCDFRAKDVERIGDDGEVEKRRLSGPDVLFDMASNDELSAMFDAMAFAMIQGNPIIEPSVKAQLEEQKKRLDQMMNLSIGGGSLTSSPANTDTQLMNSEP